MKEPKFKPGDLVKINQKHSFTKVIVENRNIVDAYSRVGVVVSCEDSMFLGQFSIQICRVELQGYPGLIVEFSSNELIEV